MQFRKIKFKRTDDGPKTLLSWREELEGENPGQEEHILKSDDPSKPSLDAALQKLTRHFLEILELPEDYGEGMRVLGVTLTWDEHGQVKKATISAKKKLRSGEIAALDTPHTQASLGAECLEDLRALCEEAEKFVRGERAQQDLFAGDGEGSSDVVPHMKPVSA